jgi:hypothetical protein
MSSERAILQFDPVTPQHRAFMECLRRIVLEHVDYITASSERKMVEELYAAVRQYDEWRTSAIRNLFQKYLDLSAITVQPPFIVRAEDIDPDLLVQLAKDL